jgi:hypothetical protein
MHASCWHLGNGALAPVATILEAVRARVHAWKAEHGSPPAVSMEPISSPAAGVPLQHCDDRNNRTSLEEERRLSSAKLKEIIDARRCGTDVSLAGHRRHGKTSITPPFSSSTTAATATAGTLGAGTESDSGSTFHPSSIHKAGIAFSCGVLLGFVLSRSIWKHL